MKTSKEVTQAILMMTIGLVVAGCNQAEPKRTTITEAVLQSSYDYTPPVDSAGRSRPVYLQPKVVLGWNKARVTPEGDWIGGHYTATIVEEGRWADLDEAERTGRPFVVPGEVPLIPEMGQPPGPTGGGPSEISVSNLAARVNNLEQAMPRTERDKDAGELLAAAASRGMGMSAVEDVIEPKRATASSGSSRAGASRPVAEGRAEPKPSPVPAAPVVTQPKVESPRDGELPERGEWQPVELVGVTARPVWIPYHPPGMIIEYAVPGRSETLTAEYGEGNVVKFTWQGKTYRVTFRKEPQRFQLGR